MLTDGVKWTSSAVVTRDLFADEYAWSRCCCSTVVAAVLLQVVLVVAGEKGGASSAAVTGSLVLGVNRLGEHLLGERGDSGDLGIAKNELALVSIPWPLLHDKLPRGERRGSWPLFAGITVIMDSDESMLHV